MEYGITIPRMDTAEQPAALDILTGGRVIAGVGTGSMFRDYEVVGMAHDAMRPLAPSCFSEHSGYADVGS